MYIKEVYNFRDGGTIAFSVILNVEEKEKLQNVSMDPMISIDCGMNGNGKWYNGMKSQGGTVIEDVNIMVDLIKAFEEKINRETIILENVKQFL